MADLKIGDTVWLFDINCRVYPPKGNDGRSYGAPIYREHWRPVPITGENRASWEIGRYGSFPKKKPADKAFLATYMKNGYGGYRVALSVQEVNDDVWKYAHGFRIADLVKNCDAATLRKVAELVGFKPED